MDSTFQNPIFQISGGTFEVMPPPTAHGAFKLNQLLEKVTQNS